MSVWTVRAAGFGTSFPLCDDVHPWHSIKQNCITVSWWWAAHSVGRWMSKHRQLPSNTSSSQGLLDPDGLTGSKHRITPTLLPLLSEHSGGSVPKRLVRPKLCEPWAPLCPWHSALLAPATPMPCCCLSFWSLPNPTSSHFALPTQIWAHWQA